MDIEQIKERLAKLTDAVVIYPEDWDIIAKAVAVMLIDAKLETLNHWNGLGGRYMNDEIAELQNEKDALNGKD